jgi:hypothetical protein
LPLHPLIVEKTILRAKGFAEMKFSRMLQVVVAVLVLSLLASNVQASAVYASGNAPKHTQTTAGKKHHKHHKHHASKHIAKHDTLHSAAVA